VSIGEWTLEPDAEREILLTWRERQTDPDVVERVHRYLAGLLIDVDRPHLYDAEAGVYALEAVPGTTVGIVWTLDVETREVVLAIITDS
jgi:hypothetical protein